MSSEKFEVSLKRLTDIVEELESGELALEAMIARYEEGVKLAGACNKILTQAEKRIEVLSKASDGSFELNPLDAATDDDGSAKKKKRRSKDDDISEE